MTLPPTPTGPPPTGPTGLPPPHLRSFGWVVRRALLGMAVLIVVAAGGAWLLHAGIDAGAEPGASSSE